MKKCHICYILLGQEVVEIVEEEITIFMCDACFGFYKARYDQPERLNGKTSDKIVHEVAPEDAKV